MKIVWKLLLLAAVVAGSAAVAGVVGGAAGTSLARRVLGVAPGALPGDAFPVQSTVLGETLTLSVRLPVGYAAHPDQRYPVLWTTDGRSHLEHAAATTETLYRLGLGPQTIVVAVPASSLGRASDFLPPDDGWSEWNGRADRFLEFLVDDARPAVTSEFRTTDQHLVFGHSFGGVFVSWGWSTRPDAFDGWFASSPSWWTAGGGMLPHLEAALGADRVTDVWFGATLGAEEGRDMSRWFEDARGLFDAADPANSAHRFSLTADGDHGSNPSLSLPGALAAFWAAQVR
jgi:predicted alpha/beta superfamily hydrolase